MRSQANPAAGLRVLRLGVGKEAYALEMDHVLGIRRADRMRPCPETEAAVGKLPGADGGVAVFDLAGRLGRQAAPAVGQKQVVVLKAEPRPWGLLVDRVAPGFQVSADSIHPLPQVVAGLPRSLFQAVLTLEKELLLLLGPDRLWPDFAPAGPSLAGIETALRHPLALPPAFGRFSGCRPGQKQIVLFAAEAPRPRERPLLFGVSISRVLELVEVPPVIPVPGAPAFVLGLAGWRDRPVAVIDLAGRLGLPATVQDPRSRLLIVRTPGGAEPAGLLVRSPIRIRRLPLPHWRCSRPLPVDPSLARALVELQTDTLVVPDLGRILQVSEPIPGQPPPNESTMVG